MAKNMKGKNKEMQVVSKVQNQLSFPDFVPFDHIKNCPRYNSILNRQEGDGVGIEEIDMLQMEIESILVNVMQRTRQLKIETMILDDWNNEKSDVVAKISSSSPMPSEKKTSQINKIKSFSGKPSSLNKSLSKVQEDVSNVPIVRNDIPDTFWQSVEPYCSDITEDDIKMLETQLEIQDSYMSMQKTIPPLGKHYSLQWAEDDINQQVKEGSRLIDYDAKISTPAKASDQKYNVVNPLITDSLQKVNTMGTFTKTNGNKNKEESLNYGPLTQRLISALIEQNLMTPLDNEIGDYLDKIGPPPEPMYMSPKTMARKLNLNTNNSTNVSSLERKIKKTLIEQSILDDDETGNTSDENSPMQTSNSSSESCTMSKDDEIANEIKNLHNELKTVTKQCKNTLGNLLETSKHSLAKQDLKKKITNLDTEIYDIYQKTKIARQAKKPLFKKDREKAQKAIKDRKNLKAQLNKL